jgi:hypothetical protein
MRISTWAQVPYAQARYDNEMRILDEQRVALERVCGLDLETITATSTTTTDDETDRTAVSGHEQRRLEEYELKVVAPTRKFVQEMKESGATALIADQGSFELEVVEFVVKTWDAQVVALSESSTPGMTADDDVLEGEVSVRGK